MAGLKSTEADVLLGARITEARRAAGLTQRQVASEISVSAAQLQKYEKGTNRISAVQLAIAAALTSKPIAWFLEGAVAQSAAAALPVLAERVRTVLIDVLAHDVERFTDDAYLVQDLGADSSDLVEIDVELRERFGIEFAESDLERCISVRDVIALVERKLDARERQAEAC